MPAPATTSQTTEQPTWLQIKVGVTPMYQNEAGDLFKCFTCDYQRPSSLGVATHYGRYCSKKGVKKEEEEEDII